VAACARESAAYSGEMLVLGGAASAELFDNAMQERALSGTGRGEVERRGRGAGVVRHWYAERICTSLNPVRRVFQGSVSWRAVGSNLAVGGDARQWVAGVLCRVDGF
jgi:hypothetical protein